MKTNRINLITVFKRKVHFLIQVIMVVLIVPAAAMTQSFPLPVNLGSSADFVILAKTGISTTGVTAITGDIGVSPMDQTGITGFGLILDSIGTFSTSSLVTGKIYTADYTPPTPAKMTAAVNDMETAYTEAAGRTLPDYTELYTGDLTGQALTHGLYKWSTGVLVSAGGVTISGSASDVWIFQIAGDLTLANGAVVTLIGGAQAANIFWQVAGQVTLGTTADFKGIILCQTLIDMQTGSYFDGRALAQTAVTLDANSIISPTETTTGIEYEAGLMPQDFVLVQNFPNPFNPSTTIRYGIPVESNISLAIYDIRGNLIQTMNSEHQSAGWYDVVWNGETPDGRSISTGIYLARLVAEDKSQVIRMLYLK